MTLFLFKFQFYQPLQKIQIFHFPKIYVANLFIKFIFMLICYLTIRSFSIGFKSTLLPDKSFHLQSSKKFNYSLVSLPGNKTQLMNFGNVHYVIINFFQKLRSIKSENLSLFLDIFEIIPS